MTTVNVHKAKSELSRLLSRVLAGEDVTIAKAGRPIARLVPVETPRPASRLGLDKRDWKVPEDFNDPLPPETLKSFLGDI